MTKPLPPPLLSLALQPLFAPGESHLPGTPTPSALLHTAPVHSPQWHLPKQHPAAAPVQKHRHPLATTTEAHKVEHRCTSSALSTPCSIRPIHASLTHRQRCHAGHYSKKHGPRRAGRNDKDDSLDSRRLINYFIILRCFMLYSNRLHYI